MKVFLSSPMRGLTDKEISDIREKAIKSLRERSGENVEVLDSYKPNVYISSRVNNKALYFLGGALQVLAEADIAVFCKGWEQARGCKIEESCARLYGVPCMYL